MSTNKTWPGGTVDATPTSYPIPDAADLNWQQLSAFLQALGDSAQATTFQKWAVRKATSSPVTVSATTDCVVVTDLTVAGAVTVNLPAGASKQLFIIIDGKGDAATNNITINRNGTDTIKGATSLVLSHNRDAVVLVYNGTDTDWKVLGPVTIPGSLTAADISGQIPATQIGGGAVDNTEFSYLDGVTSALQTQLNGKQPLDSDLTAIAALATTGLIARTGSGTVATRTIAAGSNKLSVTDGDGVAANPTVDVSEANLTLNNIGGTLGVTKGGTGITSGTSGGVPYFSAGTTIASSGALTASGVVLGGGAGASPTSTAAGSANQVLRVPGGGGAPAFGAVDLAQSAAVTGTLPVGNGGTGITSLGTGVATFLGVPSSANLAAALTDETGSGAAVFGTSPSLTTPTLTTPRVDAALNLQQISTPSNPSSGFNKVYPKSDGLLYKLDSAGNEVLVGSGSGAGEINIVINPDADTALDGSRTNGVGDWVDSGTGTTSTRTTTAAEIPLSPTKTNGIKIANDGSSTGYTRLRMTLPVALQNRKLKIAWQQLYSTGTAYASGDFKLELYSNAASNYGGAYTAIALSTDASGVTSIPALNGQFQTTFDSSTAANLELRITRVAGTASSYIALNAVTVGPGIQPQGAVVGEWQSYTSTVTNGTPGTSTATAYWRRVGSSMQIQYSLIQTSAGTAGSGTYFWSIPSGYTINTAVLPVSSGSNGYNNVGSAHVFDGAGPAMSEGSVQVDTSTGNLYLIVGNSGGATVAVSSTSRPFSSNASMRYSFNATVPISEWSGSGTVNLAQNDVEYASNSNTADSDNAAAFAYGPDGSAFPGALTAARSKTVRFNTPIQVSDKIEMQVRDTDSGKWVPINYSVFGSIAYQLQNTTEYGVRLNPTTTTTDVAVVFQQYAYPNGATFGAAGASWATLSTIDRWRLVKSSAGAAVGFGIVVPGTSAGLVSASGVPGNTTGNAIATGYVGEAVTASRLSASSLSLTTATSATLITSGITLTAGVWEIGGFCGLVGSATATTEIISEINTSSSPSITDPDTSRYSSSASNNINTARVHWAHPTFVVNISATTSYYITIRVSFTGGTCSAYGRLQAFRRA
jgi:hypothetical protein